jgi:hypothetical protein
MILNVIPFRDCSRIETSFARCSTSRITSMLLPPTGLSAGSSEALALTS